MRVADEHRFVVDCEYSSETHELISMAIVPLYRIDGFSIGRYSDPEREFYEVINPLPQHLSSWVQTNVIPYLCKSGISKVDFIRKLEEFLLKHKVRELHYDWCDDIAYFNRLMVTGPGERIAMAGPSLSHIHHPNIVVHSHINHNALEDARAIAAAIRARFAGLEDVRR